MPTTRPAKLRLFVALWPGASVRRALAAQRDAVPWPATARPTPSDKLHMTLHFLGAVAADRLPALSAALATAPAPPFGLTLDTVHTWRGGLVVLQPSLPPPALGGLHEALGEVLRGLGLPLERRAFKPHVTLARDAPRPLPPFAPAAPLHWPVEGHALVHSTPDGRYVVLQRYGHDRA